MRLPLCVLLLGPLGCDGGKDTGADEGYHPAGWEASTVHGRAAKHQEDACLSCHGADGEGVGEALSCDSCHPTGWRTDCTFCHGGADNTTGAPPTDIDNATTDLSFPAHTKHVTTTIHTAWECTTCHATPTTAFDAGHFLVSDDTPGVAEVDLSGGLSSGGSYDATAGCSNLYCHGDGQGDNGAVEVTATVVCGDCHPGPDDSRDWAALSGAHADHLREGLACADCHAPTVNARGEIVGTDTHVNGTKDIEMPAAVTQAADGCTGTCHNARHNGVDWR